ncbi:hypothetical protein PENANT_c155G02862 [Penicillium antarcticum]|uniref:HAT C-terminal dimerisation domain-containing protein n=1 Tax=Penicillium antarcticum TaxID=416450 RepID=A0A1V6PE45_9EURO|nr:hypothetical protein PENANT_c155G02862 [Penicillium antarcticum]
MSQLSNPFSASLFEGEGGFSDNPSYFVPDDTPFSSPIPPQSQQTLDTTPGPSFLHGSAPQPIIPNNLTRVHPSKTETCLVYEEMSAHAFVAWWLQTDYGRKKRINWDTKLRSSCWEGFMQVADIRTGKPAVMCTRCKAVLRHPATSRSGTSSMNHHLKSVQCQRARPTRTVKEMIEKSALNSPVASFEPEVWEQKLLTLLAVSRLPFRFIDHPEFHNVIHYARLSKQPLSIPSAKTIRSRLSDFVAFMAVTGYFVDVDWEYQEVLLGFEPLSGKHSGVNLAEVLLKLLQKHQIEDRVFTITTDNASNNSTLITSIQDSLQLLESSSDSTIIRIPCMAHGIQLCLGELLGKMKAVPKNKSRETEWCEEERIQQFRGRQQRNDIADTLRKVRNFAVWINASPQRLESFLNLQSEEPKLVPIQDFCSHTDHVQFNLNNEEWRQIDYLLSVTEPFFRIYNRLFNHLIKMGSQLKNKRVKWKRVMYEALEAAQIKLSRYYANTDNVPDDLFAIGTILAPTQKLQFFSTPSWKNDEIDWRSQYRRSFEKLFQRYKARTDLNTSDEGRPSTTGISELELELQAPVGDSQFSPVTIESDELTKYLEGGLVRSSPRVFWKEHQNEFPILANIARDILSIPATGAGVERLFNSARDICHYRRGSLKSRTIQELMMYMCTSRLDLQEDYRLLMDEYLTKEERQAALDERNTEVVRFDPISDDEEVEDEDISTITQQTEPETQEQSAVAKGKRRRSVASEADDIEIYDPENADDDDNGSHPLPAIQPRAYS